MNTNPQGIALGPDGHLWFAEEQADQIGEAIPHPDDGPSIVSVRRVGIHNQPTTLVLTFNQPLDPTTATNLANYQLFGPNLRPVRITSAVHDQAADTVTLSPASRLNVHWNYLLTVVGTPPNGVRDAFGTLLDGAGTGEPGSDYQATITWRNLVIRQTSAAVKRAQLAAARLAQAEAKAAALAPRHR